MSDGKIDWKPIWWTTIIVAIATIFIGQVLNLVAPRVVDQFARAQMQGYFSGTQSVNYPLLFLLTQLVVTFLIVWVYRMILPQLPANWIVRGLLVGFFLFLVSDLPNSIVTGYTTIAPAVVAWSILLTGLVNKLINGCILTYCFNRFSSDYQKDKSAQSQAQTKGSRKY